MDEIEDELTELLKDVTKYHLDEHCKIKQSPSESICEIKIIHINSKNKDKNNSLLYYFDNLTETELSRLLETFEPLKKKHEIAS